MTIPAALVVEDEADLRELIELSLAGMELDVVGVGSLAEAQIQLDLRPFALCLTDLRLPDGMSLPLVERINRDHPQTPVAVLTAYGNVETAVQALKAGAFDFVSKPVDIQQLRSLVQTALRLAAGRAASPDASAKMIGDSPAVRQARATIAKLARSQAPVYISGESGSGKELAARLVHELSPRAAGPFVPVNCGAIPAELLESEFFGHKKGSFTGASADKIGLFQAAHGGTLLLDEVAELPMAMQVKLLRAIQEKAIRPIGANTEQSVDVRLISATHKNLHHLVERGAFRQDLYYRINVIELAMPPLRERREDIPKLAAHILTKLDPDGRTRLSAEASAALADYGFPGNIRELENILERSLALCDGDVISPEDLHLPAPGSGAPGGPAGAAAAAALGSGSSGYGGVPAGYGMPGAAAGQGYDPALGPGYGTGGGAYSPGSGALPGSAVPDRGGAVLPGGGMGAGVAGGAGAGGTGMAGPGAGGFPGGPAPGQGGAGFGPGTAAPGLPPEGPGSYSHGLGGEAGRDAPLEDYIEQLERDRILKALEANRYNKTKTAQALGITFRALRYRLKKLGIE